MAGELHDWESLFVEATPALPVAALGLWMDLDAVVLNVSFLHTVAPGSWLQESQQGMIQVIFC